MRMDEGLENKSRRANNPDDMPARAAQGVKGISPAAPQLMPDPASPSGRGPPRAQPSRRYSRDPSPDAIDEPSRGSQGQTLEHGERGGGGGVRGRRTYEIPVPMELQGSTSSSGLLKAQTSIHHSRGPSPDNIDDPARGSQGETAPGEGGGGEGKYCWCK